MADYFTQFKTHYSTIFVLKSVLAYTVLLVAIDYLNILTKFINITNVKMAILLAIGLIFLSILLTIEWNIIDIFQIESINISDLMIISSIFSSISYIVSIFFLDINNLYKLYVIVSIIILSLFLLLYRIFKISVLLKNQKVYKSNVLDFRQIYENNFEIVDDLPILIDEKDVHYDLLGRNHITSLLTTAVLNTNPSNSFVMSLEGTWGSGKTTILNLAKIKLQEAEPDNIIIIDDLDPWSYESPESLFNSMFSHILTDSDLNFNPFETSQFINQVYSEIFSDKKVNTLKKVIFPPKSLEDIKREINNHLRLTNKKVVFFIDNIDRAEKENIIILFKLVGNILDFERVVYVLSFDSDRVKKILEEELNINYQFVKKIIQMQIRVPVVEKNVYRNIFSVIISNILSKYEGLDDNINNKLDTGVSHTELINFMANNTVDLRDFKIFINSALNFSYRTINFLNKRDLLILEYIRLNNIFLYQEIYNNSFYFVSHDRELSSATPLQSYSYNKEFDAIVIDYYDNLFKDEENKKYIDLLKVLFPYVANYHKNKVSKAKIPVAHSDVSFEFIHKNKSICSYKYFTLYFTYTDNKFIEVNRIISQFIYSINESPGNIEEIYNNMIAHSTSDNSTHLLLSTLEYYLTDINNSSKYNVTKSIYNSLKWFDPINNYIALETQNRCTSLISRLIEIVSEEDFIAFLNLIENDYSRVKNIGDINKLFSYLIKNNNLINRSELLTSTFSKLCHLIVERKIDLYSDEYYQMWNIRVVKDKFKSDDTSLTFKKYINELLNEKNIFRFLWDMTTVSYNSNEVRYYLREKIISEYTSREHIESILYKTNPSNEGEKQILIFYQNIVDAHNDDDFNIDKGVRFTTYLQPTL